MRVLAIITPLLVFGCSGGSSTPNVNPPAAAGPSVVVTGTAEPLISSASLATSEIALVLFTEVSLERNAVTVRARLVDSENRLIELTEKDSLNLTSEQYRSSLSPATDESIFNSGRGVYAASVPIAKPGQVISVTFRREDLTTDSTVTLPSAFFRIFSPSNGVSYTLDEEIDVDWGWIDKDAQVLSEAELGLLTDGEDYPVGLSDINTKVECPDAPYYNESLGSAILAGYQEFSSPPWATTAREFTGIISNTNCEISIFPQVTPQLPIITIIDPRHGNTNFGSSLTLPTTGLFTTSNKVTVRLSPQ